MRISATHSIWKKLYESIDFKSSIFILSYTDGFVDDKKLDLSNLGNLDIPEKNNDKFHGIFIWEFASTVLDELIALKSKMLSFSCGVKKISVLMIE